MLSADSDVAIFVPFCDSHTEKLIGNGIFLACVPTSVCIYSHWLSVFLGLQNKHS